MARDGQNVYSKPNPDVETNTAISSSEYNGTIDDLAAEQNAARPIKSGGTGATTAEAARINLKVARTQASVTDTVSERGLIVGAFGLGDNAPPASNFNQETVTGFARTADNTATNTPISSDNIVVQTIVYDDLKAVQIAAHCNLGEIYTRSKTGGSWGDWRIITHNANIVGTVGYTGGQPDGPIFESSANDNRGYIRFADGTQICHRNGLILNTQQPGHLRATWNFPAPFVDNNYSVTATVRPPADGGSGNDITAEAIPTKDAILAPMAHEKTGASVAIRVHRAVGTADFGTNDRLYVDVIAIGRWR